MTQTNPSFLRRIGLAFGSFFSILGNAEFAGRVLRAREAVDMPAPIAPAPAAPSPAPLREAPHEAALQLLGLLQRDARFIDFVLGQIPTTQTGILGDCTGVGSIVISST